MLTDESTDPLHQCLDPLHRVATQPEGGLEHDPHEEEENRESQHLMCHEEVDQLGAGRLLDLVLLKGLPQGSRYETVACVGEGGLAIHLQQVLDLLGRMIPFL